MSVMKFVEIITGKKVLFITTKNLDYLRNTQEINIIKDNANSIDIISSNKKNNIFRIIDVWKQLISKKLDKYETVFVGFEPQFVIPFLGRKMKKKKIIIDFFISVYDTLACDRKVIHKNGILANYCRYLDQKTLNYADCILTDTKAHASYFIQEFNADEKKFDVLYLEADSGIYYPREQRKPEVLKNKFVILYFGSILPLQGVDVVLEAVKSLKECDDLFFDIIGPIPTKYNKPMQNNVEYTDWLPQTDLAQRIANADLCLAGHFSGNIDKAWRTIPGKVYIYEAMKKPMILGDSVANRELFLEDKLHYYVEMGNSDALENKILECLDEFKRRK